MSTQPGSPPQTPVGTKLAYHLDGVGPSQYRHPNLWKREPAANGERLLIGPNHSFLNLYLELAKCLQPPYTVLYVLSVPRVREAGRYQLEGALDWDGLKAFLEPYRTYLEGDARHHLWLHSHDSSATLVYDKHDILYAYGPLDCYIETLERNGLKEGEFDLPFPHYHNYFPEFDREEAHLIDSHTWKRTGILPGVDD